MTSDCRESCIALRCVTARICVFVRLVVNLFVDLMSRLTAEGKKEGNKMTYETNADDQLLLVRNIIGVSLPTSPLAK